MSHISAIETLAEQLKNMGEAPTLNQICTKIIYTLPSHLRGFITTWESLPKEEQNIPLLTAKILNEESKNALFQPQDLGFHANSHGNRGGYGNREGYGNKGGYTGGNGARDGPPTKKARYTGPPCDFCTTKGTIATHPFSECRKKVHAAKRDSANAAFLLPPIVDFGLPASSSVLAYRDPSNWFADSGATAHLTNQRHLLRNLVSVPVGSWVIQGLHDAKADVHAYGDVIFEALVNGKKRIGSLKKVLYAPDAGINLISIGAVTALGTEVIFSGEKVIFKKNNVIEVTGFRAGKTLYKLDIKAIVESIQEERSMVVKQSGASLFSWHLRMGHVNCTTIQRMAANGSVDGIVITDHALPRVCTGCNYGKMCRKPFLPKVQPNPSQIEEEKELQVGNVIVSDVGGPMQETSLGGASYYVAFKDKVSGYRRVFFIKKKSEVVGKFKIFVSSFQNETGKLIKCLRTDNGTEYKGADWIWVEEIGIKRQYTVAYSPQQNGVSERDNRTIVEAARSALYGKSHPVSQQILLRLWAEAIAYAVYTLNRTLSRTKAVTPFEKYYGTKPNISHLRQFGCICFVHVPDKTRQKWDKKGEKGMFLGYDDTSTGFRVLIIGTLKIRISIDVEFDEENELSNHLCAHSNQQHLNLLPNFPFSMEQAAQTTGTLVTTIQVEPTINVPSTPVDTSKSPMEDNQAPIFPPPALPVLDEQNGSGSGAEGNIDDELDPQKNLSICEDRRYPRRNRKPKVIKSMQSVDAIVFEPFEPNSYREAMGCQEAQLWQPSVQEEYDSHMKNGTWSLEPLPAGRKAIGCRWVFKVKPGHLDTPTRYKSRFVAKGYSQIKGIDFKETYAPVVGYCSLRAVLSICAVLNLDMAQLDIKTAFLYGQVEEEIFIEQPEGFIVVGQEHLVGRLNKCIYGLKQSPNVWNTKFNGFLIKFGFTRSKHDPCVYFRRREEEILILIIWVDDGLICSNSKTAQKFLLFWVNILKCDHCLQTGSWGSRLKETEKSANFTSIKSPSSKRF